MSEKVEQSQEAPVAEKSDIAQQIEELAEGAAQAESLEAINENPGLEAEDVDVPDSPFWDNKSEAEEEEQLAEPEISKAEQEEVAEDVPAVDTQIIKFKANGTEHEITLEEAKQKLAMAEGGAQAFTKLAKVNKRVKELESSLPELQKKAELLDKLEEVKHDWKAVLQIATGQDPDQFLAEAVRKQRILENGSASEKAQLEKEERLAQLERQLQAQQEKQAEIERREQERAVVSEKDSLKSLLEGEFFKHKFELESELDSNDVNEMLWQQGQRRMTQYVKKYQSHPKFKELLPKMAQKSFEDVAGKLQRLTTGQVQAKVDEAIKQKKQKAAEKAAVASTRNIEDPMAQDFSGLSVRDIANKLTGSRKFSL